MKINQIKYNNCSCYIREFNSISEVAAFVKREEGYNPMWSPNERESLRYSYDNGWHGTRNMEEALDLLEHGWSDKSVELVKGLKVRSKATTKVVNEYDVAGFQVCVPRYLQGIPTSMINKRIVAQKCKVADVYVCLSFSSSVNPESITKHCIEALHLVNTLEKKGTKCNVYCYNLSTKGGEIFAPRIKLKSASERLNITKLAFPMCHPSMLRRVILNLHEKETRLTSTNWVSSYGTPIRDTNSAQQIFGADNYYM